MPITISIPNAADSTILDEAFDIFRQIDQKYSPYKTDSDLSRYNNGTLVNPSAEFISILTACEALVKPTNGYFNANIQGKFDPSGYVKGWAIEKVRKHISKLSVSNFFVDAGGDIFAAGNNAHGMPWRTGIRNPFDTEKLVAVVKLSDMAIATSGSYERGNHIYNPHTRQSISEILSFSVIGPAIITADVLATAAYAMGENGIDFIAQQPGYEAMFIEKDGTAKVTAGFQNYLI